MTSSPADGVRLATFVQVARHGSISAAARVLEMTASAVSQQMSQLEKQCGVPLLDRRPRGVSLTGAGEVLLAQAEDVVRALEETETTMAQLSGKVAGRVRVGSIASAAAAVILPAITVLARSAPDLRMTVQTVEPTQSIEALLGGQLDLAVIDVYDHVPLPLPSHLLVEEVASEPLVLVSARGTDLPERPSLSTLKDQTWVLPPAGAACGAATRYACRAAGFEPRVGWETDDLLLLVVAVSRGEGVALLPRRAVADSVAPVDVRRLSTPRLSRRLLTVSRREAANRPTVRACLDAIQHVSRHAPARD
jgi:molybdate transport repressor ModE-like protein